MMKMVKKALTVAMLSLSMLVASIPVQNIVGMQETAKAATIKLNKKNIILTIGKSAKLKVTGTKKKAYWYSDDYNIATVNSKGVVKAEEVGKTWIHVSVAGKSFKCKVTVRDFFVEKDAKVNTSETIYKSNGWLYVILKNNYKYPEDIDIKCFFYDSKNRPIDTREYKCYFLEKGREGLFAVPLPDDYASYEINYDFSKSTYFSENKSLLDKVDVESNKVDETEDEVEQIFVTFRNNSNLPISATAIVKYYDANGNIVGAETADVSGVKPNRKDIVEVDTPRMPVDDSYMTIPYTRYEVVLSTVTNDNW